MNQEKIIDGKKISGKIKDDVKASTDLLKSERGITPGLAFIIVGEDPASKVYVRNKGKACDELGFYSVTEHLPEDVSEKKLLDLIGEFNDDIDIHGILVQLPLPPHINQQKVIEKIDYKKDVDGFHPVNAGHLMIGEKCFVPCTPAGVVEMLKVSGIETDGKHVVVLGRSNIVGKPVANLLLRKEHNATVTVCHSRTKNMKEITSSADILIAAIGKPEYVKSDFIKEGCVVIDVGINRVDDPLSKKGYRITGDVDFDDCFEKSLMITPVPGGVGPMTIAMLMKNTFDSAAGNIYEK
ncbi:MAG: bifunctional methylenetetrahydrofolate dehydrogenase/methenyltetrahydrofolate cyclohydrolase FolD [Ignavibacteria bacterium]|nr:bifunctional methylenetetrahydrofolate dehydrogenase/methenyltetrahydrofolate cyclohydrolase FolD [Ignavibacteria bacterium]